MAMQLRWVSSAQDVSADAWAKCFAPNVEGRWWYITLERSKLDDQFEFAYVVLERDGAIVGIAPTFIMDVPVDLVAPPLIAKFLRFAGAAWRRLRYQRTLFVGSPCADEGALGIDASAGIAPEDAFRCVHDACMQRARAKGASIVVWKDFPAELERPLLVFADSHGLFRITSYPETRVSLPPGGFDEYLKQLSSSHRHNLRKKLRRGADAGALTSSVVQRPDASTLDDIFALFWQTYEKGRTKLEKLTRDFFEEIARQDVAHFVLLRHADSGKLAAFMLCFVLGDGRVINKFIGLDYQLGDRWFLYFRLWEAAVRWATSPPIAAREIQSGQTGYRAKVDVGHELVPLTNFCRHRNPLLNWIFARATRDVGWAQLDPDLKIYLDAHPNALPTPRHRG